MNATPRLNNFDKIPGWSALLERSSDTLPDADTTPLGIHARRHVHGSELLEHELGRVRDDDLCNLGLVLAGSALELVLLE